MNYWYITYICPNATNKYGVKATIEASPAQWSIQMSNQFDDGPYIVLYAERISKEQYDYINGYMA